MKRMGINVNMVKYSTFDLLWTGLTFTHVRVLMVIILYLMDLHFSFITVSGGNGSLR